MLQKKAIHVHSEIGRLKRVLLHRPGRELENLMPEYLDRLLFDDIPYLKIAQKEHDHFAALLKKHGVKICYLQDLMAEALVDEEVTARFIHDVLEETEIFTTREKALMTEYFSALPKKEMIQGVMAGVRKTELEAIMGRRPTDFQRNVAQDYPFVTDPMPNLYFTRDPFAAVGDGVTIHPMFSVTRSRETVFAEFIFSYHPLYKNTKIWYDRAEPFSLEGGDLLILNENTVAVGISQRTKERSITKFAQRLLSEENGFRKILAFNIPKQRTFMHLDTVFTMVDRDKFTVHPNILQQLDVFIIEEKEGKIVIRLAEGSLADILKEQLNLDDVQLIRCGSNSVIDAAREQWNDGSNTLAIAPGKVVVYARNAVTNEILKDAGIKIYELPCSELSRGRGGPRCMSMPLLRGDL
ncbi:MAG TPA: arginine deiminase [Clostridiales bacterium]|nr:arginine deiminase [Clostridiales bacterium]